MPLFFRLDLFYEAREKILFFFMVNLETQKLLGPEKKDHGHRGQKS